MAVVGIIVVALARIECAEVSASFAGTARAHRARDTAARLTGRIERMVAGMKEVEGGKERGEAIIELGTWFSMQHTVAVVGVASSWSRCGRSEEIVE